jgi:hypothetical protein
MASLDANDFGLILQFERHFARTLGRTLSSVFDAHEDVGNAYIESISAAPWPERLIALHESPIDVAAMLTGAPITDEMRARYNDLFAPQDWQHQLSLEEPVASPFQPMTKENVEAILTMFGYEKLALQRGRVLWYLRDANKNMRSHVMIRYPRRVDAQYVIELISFLFRGRISRDALTMILREMLYFSE